MRVNKTLAAVLLSVQAVGCTFASAETAARPITKPGWTLLKPGDRVRITAPGVFDPTGAVTFVAVRADSLVVRRDPNTWSVPIAAITQIEVQRRGKPNTRRGALIGVLVGGVVGAVVGYTGYEDECEGFGPGPCGPGVFAVMGVIVGGAAGAVIGALTGALVRPHRWLRVPLEQLDVSVAPQRGGRFALGFSVTF